jgi:hypothetical protein
VTVVSVTAGGVVNVPGAVAGTGAPTRQAYDAADVSTGARRMVSVPSPSCPLALAPQPHTTPLPSTAVTNPAPTPRVLMVGNPDRVGTLRAVVVPSPSWPELFEPHSQIAPALVRAAVKSPPASNWTMSAGAVGTNVGTPRAVVVPSPSCPLLLAPQAYTVPLVSRASECVAPAVTALAPVSPATGAGVLRFVVVPSPSCFEVLRPQAHTVPSDLTAKAWSVLAAMATMPDRAAMCVGAVRWVVVPSPSCP